MSALEMDIPILPAGANNAADMIRMAAERRKRLMQGPAARPPQRPMVMPICSPDLAEERVSLDNKIADAFAGFCVTEGNRVAYLAAKAFVAERAGDLLFICGAMGTGKTALAEAIRKCSPAVVIDHAGRRGSDVMKAINAGKMVVLTDTRSMNEWDDMRTAARCRSAMSVDLSMMAPADALAIIRHIEKGIQAHTPTFEIAEDFAEAIAYQPSVNGHLVTGVMRSLMARHWARHPVTLSDLYGMLPKGEERDIRVQDIIAHVCEAYHVSKADMLSQRRSSDVVNPRQIAMYLSKTMTLKSLPEIGRIFGGRDHTTVLHAVRKIEALEKKDSNYAGRIAALRDAIKARAK